MKVNDVVVIRKSDGKEFQKQDVVIGDKTGSCRLVLWEEDVGSLEEGKSYNLLDVVVRMYGTAKYLSYSSRCSKTLVEDMKDINDEDISGEDHEESGRVLKGEISTVISIAEYACYKSCKNKVVCEARGGRRETSCLC